MKILMAEHTHYRSLYKVGCHHLAAYLSKQNHDILYLSGPMNVFNLRYFISKSPSVKDLKYALKTWWKGGIREKKNLTSYAPMTFLPVWRKSIFSSNWVADNTLKFTVPNIRAIIKKKGFEKPDVLLISQPFFSKLLKGVEAEIKIYRITDDLDQFPNMPISMKRTEKNSALLADAVIVTSSPLIEKVKTYGVKTVHYVPNGVDYDHYRFPHEKPPEYSNMKGPIILYMGALDDWFDLETVKYCAANLPQINIVIIGAARINLSSIKTFNNVFYLGPKDYEILPGYIQHADIGIIPFKPVPLVHSVSPLKLYEYMACGLPVVSTRWRELENINSPAYLASNNEEFMMNLKICMQEGKRKSRLHKEFAINNSWEERGKKIEHIFRETVENRRKISKR